MSLRLSLLFILSFFLIHRTSAQEFRYLIHLKDKNNSGFDISNPSGFLTEKSIQRRQKQHIAIDSADLPVSTVYTDSISTIPGLRILNKSRWFNLLLISVSDTALLQQVRSFS